ncbi:hypothetical protein BDN67DRAFT_962535 [Paxillus ammoniavirescens]|nr:hypothetical protein BDN67DRAFT_962535 [Paxillus ammoniavirescens]
MLLNRIWALGTFGCGSSLVPFICFIALYLIVLSMFLNAPCLTSLSKVLLAIRLELVWFHRVLVTLKLQSHCC